jgi:hypothetical protein
VTIGTSIGIALPEPGVPAAELLERADVAHARRGLEADLRPAVKFSEFGPAYPSRSARRSLEFTNYR